MNTILNVIRNRVGGRSFYKKYLGACGFMIERDLERDQRVKHNFEAG